MGKSKSNIIAVRCVCGKKFKVRQKSVNAAIACPECGHIINLSPTASIEKTSAHWTQNLLWIVWTVPVCIAVTGLLYILATELRDKPIQAPPAKIADNEVPEVSFVEVQKIEKKILFPGEPLDQITDLSLRIPNDKGLITLRTNAIFKEKNGELFTTIEDVTAMRLADSVHDFSLDVLGEFDKKGGMHFLIGWNSKTKTGYILTYSRQVNYGYWKVQFLQNGEPAAFPSKKLNHIVRSGELNISVKGKRISLSMGGEKFLEDLFLPNYSPGEIVMGTWHNMYKGKSLIVKQIALTALPVPKETEQPVNDKGDRPLENILLEPIFPNNEFLTLAEPALREKNFLYEVDGSFKHLDEKLVSERANSTALELVHQTGNFEIAIDGDFRGKGYVLFFIGWNNDKNTGYLIRHNRMVTSGLWEIVPYVNGEVQPRSYIDNFRIPESGQLSFRVENRRLSIDFEGHVITNQFILPHYNPGAIIIGTQPNKYRDRSLTISKILFRESTK